jgi:hypothetical protein
MEAAAVSTTPTPMAMAMEQADPGGVSCTTRNVSPWLKSRSTLKPGWSASKVSRGPRRYGDWHQLELEAHGTSSFLDVA